MRELGFKIYVRGIVLSSDKSHILLVQKRLDQKIAPGKFLFPGGTVEFGEEPEKTLAREFQEETSLEIRSADLFAHRTMLIDSTHWLGLYYLVDTVDSNQAKNCEPEKHTSVSFVPVSTILSSENFSDQELLKKALL